MEESEQEMDGLIKELRRSCEPRSLWLVNKWQMQVDSAAAPSHCLGHNSLVLISDEN